VYDIDNDGKDEIFRGEYNGSVRAFDDDGSELWSNNDHDRPIFWLEIGWRGPGSSQMYILALAYGLGVEADASLIFADTGVTHWFHTLPTSPLPALLLGTMGDVLGDTESEVIITNVNDEMFVLNLDGSIAYNSTWPTSWQAASVTVGNFSDNVKNDIALVHTNGTISVISGHNGTVLFTLNGTYGWDYQKPVVADMNGDGWDDLVLAKYNLFVADLNNRSTLYNSTVNLGQAIDKLYVGDYDNDTLFEVIMQTDNQVVYEEVTSGRMVWRYELGSAYEITDSMAMVLPDGRVGIGICTDIGDVAAIDAITGVVKWFAQSSNSYNEVIVGNFDDDPQDELGASDQNNGDIYIYEELIPWMTTPSDPFGYWTLYWNDTISPEAGYSISGVWTADVDSDGDLDYVVSGSDGRLYLYDPIHPSMTWTRTLDFVAKDVKFVHFNADGVLDILVLLEKSGSFKVKGFDGATGNDIPGVDERPIHESTRINVIAIGEFNTGEPGTEYAIAYTDTSNKTWVEFFSNTGDFKAVSSFNATSFWPTMVEVGYLMGNPNEDLALFGISFGTDGDMLMWQGDGTYIGSLPPGFAFVVDTDIGDFDGDADADLAIAWEDGVVWSYEPSTSFHWIMDMNNTVDSVEVVNIDMAGLDEIAISVRETGIIVVEGAAFVEKWSYMLPTTAPKHVYFDDFDNDGVMDMTLLIHDRIAVYDRNNEEMFGVFIPDGAPDYIRVGNIDGSGPLDVLFFVGATVYTVTDHTTPPPLPALAEVDGSIDPMSLAMMLGVPPLFFLVAIPLFMRRRRRVR
jgi:hypothetical protein